MSITAKAIRAYMDIMKIGETLNVSGPNFRREYNFKPLREQGYATHEEVFLANSVGSRYGAVTVEYKVRGDYYEIQKNEFSHRLVFVEPPERYRYYQDKAGFWHHKERA